MLIDFSVSNFRSIAEEVTLSAVAQPTRGTVNKKKGHKSDAEIADTFRFPSRNIELLPVIGILGPNGSGKSNILNALDAVLTLVKEGAGKRNRLRRFVPFGLSPEYSEHPSCFQLRVFTEDNYYEYSIEVTQERILRESVKYLPSKARVMRDVYSVRWDDEAEQYAWEEVNFHTPREVANLQKRWRGAVPFLSTFADQFSWDALNPLANWIELSWSGIGIGEHADFDEYVSTFIAAKLPGFFREVMAMMQQLDSSLDDMEVREKLGEDGDAESHELIAVHHTPHGAVKWNFENESVGTRALFPLSFKVMAALARGGCAIIDELGANVHRSLTHLLIQLFQSKETNPKGAQLIFATHDTTMLEDKQLRRDQVWFTARLADKSTELYPAAAFHPRPDLDLYQAYLNGRFGALPVLPRLVDIVPVVSRARQVAEEE